MLNFEISVYFHRGYPDEEFMVRVFEVVAAKELSLRRAKRPQALAAAWNRSKDFFATCRSDEKDGVVVSMTGFDHSTRDNHLTIEFERDSDMAAVAEDTAVQLVDLLNAPLALITAADGTRSNTYHDRIMRWMEVIDAQKGFRTGYDLTKGLLGVAWRIYLSNQTLRMFCADRLEMVDNQYVQRLGDDLFVLKAGDQPSGLLRNEYSPEEAEVVKLLGQEYFFDPGAETLPEVVPGEYESTPPYEIAFEYPVPCYPDEHATIRLGLARTAFHLDVFVDWAKRKKWPGQNPAIMFRKKIVTKSEHFNDLVELEWGDIVFSVRLLGGIVKTKSALKWWYVSKLKKSFGHQYKDSQKLILRYRGEKSAENKARGDEIIEYFENHPLTSLTTYRSMPKW